MNSAWHETDDDLLQELGASLRRPADPDLTAMLMNGFDLAMADFIETELLFDSLKSEAAPVRSGESVTLSPRTMAFGTSGVVEIEIELIDGRLIGHIDPPQASHAFLDQVFGSEATEPDDIGGFEFDLPTANFRIRLEIAGGATYVTPWIGPHSGPTGSD